MSDAIVLWNDLQQATGVNVSELTITNRLHKSAWWPWSTISIFHTILELAGPPLVPCDFQFKSRFTLSACDWCVWRSCGECYVKSLNMTGLVVGHWWSGEAYPWKDTDLYRLGSGTLTYIRYQFHVMRVCSQLLEDEGIDITDWPFSFLHSLALFPLNKAKHKAVQWSHLFCV